MTTMTDSEMAKEAGFNNYLEFGKGMVSVGGAKINGKFIVSIYHSKSPYKIPKKLKIKDAAATLVFDTPEQAQAVYDALLSKAMIFFT